jgi:putative tryptophan/tyrosine transport system substrate-binding protein
MCAALTPPGVSLQTTDIAGKRLELLRELVPGVRRLAFVANVAGPNARLEMDEVRAAARKLNIDIVPLEIQSGEDIAPAFEALKSLAEALYVALVSGDPLNRSAVPS